MVILDENLSSKNGNLIYKLNHENPPIAIVKFEKRIVADNKICYVLVVSQGEKYYMFGSRYTEEFIGFEISKNDIDLIKDYFKTYEIERLINLGISDYEKEEV